MPVYNGIYYYLNNLDAVDAVCLYENRWWARYASVYDMNLPISITPEEFPENTFCPVALYEEEFENTLQGQTLNIFMYTQDEQTKNLILSSAPKTAKNNPTILKNGAVAYRWIQKSNSNTYGVIFIYDKNRVMTQGKILVHPGVIIAIIVCIFMTIWAGMWVYDNKVTQEHATERTHALLDALRWESITDLPDGSKILHYGNGTVLRYDPKTGKVDVINEGVSGKELADKIPTGDVGGITQTLQQAISAVVYLAIIIAIVVVVIFIARYLLTRKSKG